MKLTIVSGLSGSGKSVALHTLEDEDYYCVDNLPASLLPELMNQLSNSQLNLYQHVAVGLDARSESSGLKAFPKILQRLRDAGLEVEILFLQTDTNTLVRRFNETRRKHPLSGRDRPLVSAIEIEKNLLAELIEQADMTIDTTQLNLHQLRQQIANIVIGRPHNTMSLLFQSFGFKHGIPGDTDFVFDVRCLPNPHWDPTLRSKTGRDSAVVEFLEQHNSVESMFNSVRKFLSDWIPSFKTENRAYLTVSIGCTGGRHRSVYIAERLNCHFSTQMDNVLLRHRELSLNEPPGLIP